MSPLPSYIFGMHDPGAESLFTAAGKTGWIVVTVKLNPPDSNGDFSALGAAGFGVIVRLNNGYNSDGTIPFSSQYDTFASQCADFVRGSRGASIWIIGNEPNIAIERPGNNSGVGGETITPALYGRCFAKCATAIKRLSGHSGDWVVPAATAPWNNQTAYAGNTSGDWIKYFTDTLAACAQAGASPDALALHTYTHGFNKDLITSEETMGAPFQNRRFQFRTYRDFMAAIPTNLRNQPVFITETQAADPDWWQDRNIGWIQAAYAEINAWNAVSTAQPIQALCLFRWQTGNAQWSISDRPALIGDFRTALQNNYRVRWRPTPDPVAQAAIAAAQKYTWMPINTGAALYKFAQSKDLGYPQTDEFEFPFGSDTYIAQVFNLGIVYVKKGDWENVAWIAKPAGM